MTRKELIELLSHSSYNDNDEVVIETNGYRDYHILEVYKDGKGDICLIKGPNEI